MTNGEWVKAPNNEGKLDLRDFYNPAFTNNAVQRFVDDAFNAFAQHAAEYAHLGLPAQVEALAACEMVACLPWTEEKLEVTHVYKRCAECGGNGRGAEAWHPRHGACYEACTACDGYGAIAVPVGDAAS